MAQEEDEIDWPLLVEASSDFHMTREAWAAIRAHESEARQRLELLTQTLNALADDEKDLQ